MWSGSKIGNKERIAKGRTEGITTRITKGITTRDQNSGTNQAWKRRENLNPITTTINKTITQTHPNLPIQDNPPPLNNRPHRCLLRQIIHLLPNLKITPLHQHKDILNPKTRHLTPYSTNLSQPRRRLRYRQRIQHWNIQH